MLAHVRVGFVAALVTLASIALSSIPAAAAAAPAKPYQRADLADAAIKLEAEIKTDAGQPGKPVAQLRRDADAAFQKNDVRSGMVLLGQIIAQAPDDSATWLQARPRHPAGPRRSWTAIASPCSSAPAPRPTSPISAPTTAARRPMRCSSSARTFGDRGIWRPALDSLRISLELRENADVRVMYEKMREDHGFRLLDYSVDADSASPRACFQFSEELPNKRVDFSPFVSVAGQDKLALSADDKQLCVEGLKHGERYSVTLRAGLPSTVKETLPKSAELTIYVRDRKPMAHFAGKAYVLPRTGQRGIPVVSVNTKSVGINVYRISDRNLIETVLGREFQRNLYAYEIERLTDSRGIKVWSGELAVEQTLNAEITTAFPVDQAIGDMVPGVYVMTAVPKGTTSDDYDDMPTQWFVVSDMGLAAYSGVDGINVFVNSLASTEPKGQVEVRLMSRGNEVLATKKTDGNGRIAFEAGLSRGEGASSPAMLIASDAKGDYAFLSLKTPAFDLSDRGVSGRPAASGLDAFVYTERGVYRSGETVHVMSLLRDAQGVAAPNVPLTLVVERPDGIEYRRVAVPDQGIGGHALDVPINPAATTGTWRVRAFTDPKRPSVGETTFLVEDYVPDRLEFDLASPTGKISKTAPAKLTVDGRYLYGAPASALDLEGELVIAPGQGAAGPGRLSVRPRRRGGRDHAKDARGPAADRRQGQGELRCRARQAAGDLASARRQGDRAAGRKPAAARSSAPSRCRCRRRPT